MNHCVSKTFLDEFVDLDQQHSMVSGSKTQKFLNQSVVFIMRATKIPNLIVDQNTLE